MYMCDFEDRWDMISEPRTGSIPAMTSEDAWFDEEEPN